MTKREAWQALQDVAPSVAEAVRKARERFGELHSVEIHIGDEQVWPNERANLPQERPK